MGLRVNLASESTYHTTEESLRKVLNCFLQRYHHIFACAIRPTSQSQCRTIDEVAADKLNCVDAVRRCWGRSEKKFGDRLNRHGVDRVYRWRYRNHQWLLTKRSKPRRYFMGGTLRAFAVTASSTTEEDGEGEHEREDEDREDKQAKGTLWALDASSSIAAPSQRATRHEEAICA